MWNSSVVKEFDGLALFLEPLHTGGSLGDAIAIARVTTNVSAEGRPDHGSFSWKTRSTSPSAAIGRRAAFLF